MSVLVDKFTFRPSAQTGILLLFGGITVCGGALIIPISDAIRITLAAILGLAFLFAGRRHAQRSGKRAIRGLHFHRSDCISVFFANGGVLTNARLTTKFVSPYLSVAVIEHGKQQFPLLITPDSLSSDDYRQLRIRLNIQKSNNDGMPLLRS